MRTPSSHDDGSAAVELAAAMPAVVLLVGAVVSVGVWGARQVAAQQAAGAAARAVLVGESGQAAAVADAAVGEGASVHVLESGGRVTITVVIGAGGWLPDARASVTVTDAP